MTANVGPKASPANSEETGYELTPVTPNTPSDWHSTAPVVRPPPAPSSLQAWTQVFSAFFVFFNTW